MFVALTAGDFGQEQLRQDSSFDLFWKRQGEQLQTNLIFALFDIRKLYELRCRFAQYKTKMTIIPTFEKIYNSVALARHELAQIADAHQPVTFAKGDYLLQKGQIANAYFCIEQGLVRSYVHDYEGQDITTGFVGEAEIAIDVVSLFQQVPALENMHALTDIIAWRIDYPVFQKLFRDIPAFSEWGRAWMAMSLFQCKQRSVSMIADTATQRYLALQQRHPKLLLQAPLKHVASYLGITDTSLSRIRKEVAKQ